MTVKKPRMKIGWEEWCALPELGLPAIKAKVDTGAKTSALHAFNIECFDDGGWEYVRFDIHPIQKNKKVARRCTAPLIDRRYVTSSNGHREKRYVIRTPVVIGEKRWEIDITLTKRDNLAFRMLLGREAMRQGKLLVDPTLACKTGRLKEKEAAALYRS